MGWVSDQIKRFPVSVGVVFFLLLFTQPFYAAAGDMPAEAGQSVQGPRAAVHRPDSPDKGSQEAMKPGTGDIHISADKLVSSRDDDTAEFSGNVLATQAGVTIQSDRLRVHYEKIPDDKAVAGSKSGMGSNRIKEIIAEGNVKIVMNNRTAFCDRAVYDVSEGLIVLTGNNVRIAQDDNFIHGSRITLNRLTGAVSVSGDPDKPDHRVEAVFNPGAEVKMPELSRPQKTG